MPGDIPLVNMPISFFNVTEKDQMTECEKQLMIKLGRPRLTDSERREARLQQALVDENKAMAWTLFSLARHEIFVDALSGLITTRRLAALAILRCFMDVKKIEISILESACNMLELGQDSENELKDYGFDKLEGIKQILLYVGNQLASRQLLADNPHLIEFFTLHQRFWQRMIEARLVTCEEEASSSERRLSR